MVVTLAGSRTLTADTHDRFLLRGRIIIYSLHGVRMSAIVSFTTLFSYSTLFLFFFYCNVLTFESSALSVKSSLSVLSETTLDWSLRNRDQLNQFSQSLPDGYEVSNIVFLYFR